MVMNPSARQETLEKRVQSLGQEDPLEEEMATHSRVLAWGNPTDRAQWATVHGVAKESDTTEHTQCGAKAEDLETDRRGF